MKYLWCHLQNIPNNIKAIVSTMKCPVIFIPKMHNNRYHGDKSLFWPNNNQSLKKFYKAQYENNLSIACCCRTLLHIKTIEQPFVFYPSVSLTVLNPQTIQPSLQPSLPPLLPDPPPVPTLLSLPADAPCLQSLCRVGY